MFGNLASQLFEIIDAGPAERINFANRISLGVMKAMLAEPWLSGFRRLGEQAVVQQLQLAIVDHDYSQPAVLTARRLNLKAELGIALAFDIHVQNGGISEPATQQIQETIAEHPSDHEQDLRIAIANAVAC